MGAKIPLFFWRKEAYGIKEATSNLVATNNALKTKINAILADIRSAYLDASTDKKLLKLYKTAILPQAKGTLESSMASYGVGKADFLTIITNTIILLDYELAYYKNLTGFEKAIANLEALTGVQFRARTKVTWDKQQ